MSREILIRPHHLFHVAFAMSGWPERLSIAEIEVEIINRYTLPNQVIFHDNYYKDLVGEKPTRPLSKNDLNKGALGDYVVRSQSAMNFILGANDLDLVKLITVGQDVICRAAAIGRHCFDSNSAKDERNRVIKIKNGIEASRLGNIDVFNIQEPEKCFAFVTFGILKSFMLVRFELARLLYGNG